MFSLENYLNHYIFNFSIQISYIALCIYIIKMHISYSGVEKSNSQVFIIYKEKTIAMIFKEISKS